MSRRLLGVLLLAMGCAPPVVRPAPPVDPPAAPSSSSVPVAAGLGPLVDVVPSDERLAELVAAVPASATLVVHLPAIDRVRTLVDSSLLDQAVQGFAGVLRDSLGVDPAVGQALFDGFDGAVLFSSAVGPQLDPASQLLTSGVVMRFRDPTPVDQLLAASRLTSEGALDWVEPDAAGKVAAVRARWSAPAGLLVLGLQADVVQAAWDAAVGTAPSFLATPAFPKGRSQQLWAWADLHRLTRGDPEPYLPGSQLFFALGSPTAGDGVGAELDVVQLGDFVPRMGSLFAPPERTVLGALPGGAQVALGVTTKRRPNVGFGEVLGELGRARQAPGLAVAAVASLHKLGLTLELLDRAIGDELAIGIYAPAAAKSAGGVGAAKVSAPTPGARDALALDAAVIGGAIESPDPTAARALVGAMAGWLRANVGSVRAGPGRISVTPQPGNTIRVEARPGMIVFAAGPTARVSAWLARFGRPGQGLQHDERFRSARERAGPLTHVQLYTDYGAFVSAGWIDGDPKLALALAGRGAMATLSYRPSERGLETEARSDSGVEIVGVLGAVAVQAFRRYLALAKAKETPGMAPDPAPSP